MDPFPSLDLPGLKDNPISAKVSALGVSCKPREVQQAVVDVVEEEINCRHPGAGRVSVDHRGIGESRLDGESVEMW